MKEKLDLEKKVLATVNTYNLINTGEKIVIGVSGGPDSVALLNILNSLKEKLKLELYVAHINHMIRQEADSETKYVQEMCDKLGIECYVKRIDVIKEASKLKIGTEEAGRNIRYNFFEEVRAKTNSNKIATAHNANDNAETVLMNILRGTGTSGLKGTPKIRNEKFIRPIIECNRKEIEEYCKINNLNPKYDKSNKENIYTRNKVRNLLIPYIEKEFNPNIIEGLNRLSQIASKEDEYFHKVVEVEYEKLLITGENFGNNINVLNLKKFNTLDYVIKSRLLLYTIGKVCGTVQGIEKIHIDDIIKLCNNNIGNKFLIPNKKIKIYIKKGKIFFLAQT